MEQIERGGLEGRLENVRDVGEDLVVEEQREQRAQNAGLGVEARPAPLPIVHQRELFDGDGRACVARVEPGGAAAVGAGEGSADGRVAGGVVVVVVAAVAISCAAGGVLGAGSRASETWRWWWLGGRRGSGSGGGGG